MKSFDFVGPAWRGRSPSIRVQTGRHGRNMGAPTSERSLFMRAFRRAYRFLVRAVTPRLSVRSPHGWRSRSFPPIWLQWWFLLGRIRTATSGPYLWRYRRRQVRPSRRVRRGIATDLARRYRIGISQIAKLSEVLGKAVAGNLDRSARSNRSPDVSRELVDSMSTLSGRQIPIETGLGEPRAANAAFRRRSARWFRNRIPPRLGRIEEKQNER